MPTDSLRITLLDILEAQFNQTELRRLCFTLQQEALFEQHQPDTAAIAMELIALYERRQALVVLQDAIRQARPQVTLSSTAAPLMQPTSIPAQLSSNPFGKKGRLDNPDHFYPRAGVLREIYGELQKGQSVVLLGEAQMGKSSLLWHIAQHGQGRLPQYEFVYLDLNTIRDGSDFFIALCHELRLPLDNIPQGRGYALYKYLRDKRYVLCLDEIERLTSAKFDREMRDELRGLAEGENAPLTLLLASHQPLSVVFEDSAAYNSPLASICEVVRLEALRLEEVAGLLNQYLRDQPVQFSVEEITGIFRHSQGLPARVQQLARELYQQKLSA